VRKIKTRKISLFNVVITIFLSSAVIVFFVYNIITVNSLVVENDALKTELNRTITVNNKLQTEIERLSSFDNIKPVAVDILGLNMPGFKPKKITISKSEIEELTK
jgi:sensor domain CHASE-containing protein